MSRKTAVTSFLVICAMAIAATPAFAGGVAFQASSLPVQVRGEGLTETVGAVVLQATGPGSITSGSSITFVFSGAITNASSFTAGGNAGVSCSGAGIVGAVPPACNANITSSASNTQLTVSFGGAAGATYTFAQGDSIEINQVRININALGTATTTATATLSGTSSAPTTNPITFTQSQVAVASIVNPSVKGSVGSGPPNIQTCNVLTTNTFSITATENYPAALTSIGDEAGFTPITTVTNGSWISVVLSNIPSGLAVQATSYTVKQGSATLGTGIAIGSAAGAITLNYAGGTSGYQASTGSSLTYTFSVTGDSTSALESYTINFSVGRPNSGNTGLNGSAGPFPAIGTTATATATVSLAPGSGIVSFATNNEGGGTIATVSDCVTNLLFPYVTNQSGYDTSYSIANTTSDDLAFGAGAGATAQNGSCTLSLWPTSDPTLSSASPLGTAVQYTTPTIPSGSVYAFSQSATTFSGQSGYVIASCRFLNAHGFAFLTNGFAQSAGPQLSHGYLGLTLANPINGTRSNSTGESLVQ